MDLASGDVLAASARETVEAEIGRFLDNQEDERLALYRALLQGTVRQVSPMTIDLAAHAGTSLPSIAAGLRPPGYWPWSPLRHTTSTRGPRSPWRAAAGGAYGRPPSLRLRDLGVVVRSEGHPGGEFGVWAARSTLESVACVGDCVLQTVGRRARLHLPYPLPETLLGALPGRELDRLVSHPVIDGRGYVIRSVAAGELGDRAVVEFGTGLLPLELPWADALRACVSRDRLVAGAALRAGVDAAGGRS